MFEFSQVMFCAHWTLCFLPAVGDVISQPAVPAVYRLLPLLFRHGL